MEERQDLISRQAAVDMLMERASNLRGTVGDLGGACSGAAKLIAQFPSAEPEQRWIPCSERLPEKSGRYLVTRKFNTFSSLWARVYILNYSDLMGLKKEKIWWSGNVGKSDFEKYDDVLAWMPLPEPYEEEKRNA